MPLSRRTDGTPIFPAADNKSVRSCAFAFYDTIAAVPVEWDHLVHGHSLFLRREYLQLLEEHGPPAVRPFYAIVSGNGRPVAVAKANIFDVDDEMLSVRDRTTYNAGLRPGGRLLDKSLTWLRNRCLGMFGRRIVLCGNLFSCGLHGVAFGREEDPARLWPVVMECLQDMLRMQGGAAYLVIKDIASRATASGDLFSTAGFSRLRLEPSMDLEVPETWHSYEDYLASLNTKYRKAARKTHEAADRAGVTLETLSDIAPVQQHFFDLYAQVERRARTRFGILRAGYLPALARMAGPENFRCSVARMGGKILGFSTVLKDDRVAVVHLVGFDYAENEKAPIYLRLLHRAMEDGLALGCTTIHFGRTALEPKARLGAVPTGTEAWVRHSNPIINRAIGWLLRLVAEDVAPQRTPFRIVKEEGEPLGVGTKSAE